MKETFSPTVEMPADTDRVYNKELALQMIENGESDSVVESLLERFTDLKLDNDLAKVLLDCPFNSNESTFTLSHNLSKFSDLDEEVALKLFERGSPEKIIDSVNTPGLFLEISIEAKMNMLVYLLTEYTDVESIIREQSENSFRAFFSPVLQDHTKCLELLNQSSVPFANKIWFSEQFKPPLDSVLNECVSIFTHELATEEQYFCLKELSEGKIVHALEQLNITKTGSDGLRQVREKMAEFRQNITSDVFDTEMLNSPIVSGMFKSIVRFESSDWGDHGANEFTNTVDTYNSVKDGIEPLPEYMIPSKVVRIDTIDKSVKFEWSEQFLSRYNQLLDSVEEAGQLVEGEKKPLSHMAEEVQIEVDAIVSNLEAKLAQVPNEKAKIGIQQRIDAIKAIEIRDVKQFQHTFKALSQFKELHPLLRKTTFALSLLKNKQQKERVETELLTQRRRANRPGVNHEITINEVTTLLDFVDHVTNKETMLEYFTDKKARDAFLEINGVKAIQEELARIQNQDVAGTMPMQFVPVRNLLTEFSGHIADACWASKYDSILESYPNFTSVIFVRDPKGKNESLAGACFLIETESESGDPLLVIRGLNPQQNIINQLSIDDFFGKFTDYVKEIAAKDGRKVAVVVDGHSGGSGTNRPVLFEYMKNLNAPSIRLRADNDTNFNGYNVVNNCVELS